MFPKIVVPPNHPFYIIGFSITNHPFWGTPIFGNTHLSLRMFRCAMIPKKKKQLVNGKGSQASLGMLWEGCFPGSPRSFPFGTHTFFGANKETHQHQSSCVQFSYPIRWYRRISGQSRSTIPLSFPVNSHDFQKILRKLLVVFLKINDLFRMILEVSEFRSTSFPAKLGSPNWSRVKRTPINTVS